MFDKLLYSISRPIIGLYAQAVLRLKVFWHAPLPNGPKILVANHPTTSDPFFVALAAREPANILIADHIFKIPVFGTYLRQLGHIPVIEGRGQVAFERAKHLLNSGKTVILFPEGELSPEAGGLHQPRTGAARLALSTGAPIIPVGIHLLQEKVRHIKSKIDGEPTITRWPFRGPYTMTIGDAVQFEGDVENRDRVRSVSAQIMEHIQNLVSQSQRFEMMAV